MGRAGRLALAALCVLLSLCTAGAQKAKNCARWCPPNSECIDGNSCRCRPGYTSDEPIIRDATQICEDINECGPPSPVSCGKFAECVNTDGSYYCECKPGFALASGEKNFTNSSENRCQGTAAPQMTPTPTPVSTISASPGHDLPFITATTRSRRGDMHRKKPNGVNECTSGQNPCHPSTHCLNKVRGYSCVCRPGWKPIPGSPNGPNNTECEDVNECESQQPLCHNSTVCNNTVGSYKCLCRQGWEPIAGSPKDGNTTVCKEITFPIWAPIAGIYSETLSIFSETVQDLLKSFETTTAKDTIQGLVEAMDKLLEAPGDLENLTVPDRHKVATSLLNNLENTLRTLARSLPAGPFTYTSPSNTELSLLIKGKESSQVTLGHDQTRMQLDWAVAAGAQSSEAEHAVAGVLSSPMMPRLLVNASLDIDKNLRALEAKYRNPVLGASVTLLSNISSVFLTNTNTKKLASNITFNFSYHMNPQVSRIRSELLCAFWQNERWTTAGCSKVEEPQNDQVTCECNHLSSFAILMAHYQVKDPRLELITKVGLSLSLICLLLCIVTFLLVRPIQSSRTSVHLHLCLCLFQGSLIFLVGVENEGGQVGLRCRLVAMMLHYLFLAAFCWMGLEGLELYFLVVRVFQGQGLGTRWRYLLGYGVPLLIVAVSAAAHIEGYGQPHYCWLDLESGFLWSFVGPLAFVMLGNSIIFVITVWKLTHKFSEINPDMKKLRKARVLTITTVAQFFVLGCTWVFGLFLFDPHSHWLSYVFTVLNCLQGVFLYVMLCLLNKKVREEYWKWACVIAGNKYSEFSSSTTGTGTSHNQTRTLRPSESGM